MDTLRVILEENLDTKEESYVQFKKWTSTDRAELETLVETATYFIHHFIPAVLKQNFISRAQAAFLLDSKKNLKEDEVIVTGISQKTTVQSFRMSFKLFTGQWNKLQSIHLSVMKRLGTN